MSRNSVLLKVLMILIVILKNRNGSSLLGIIVDNLKILLLRYYEYYSFEYTNILYINIEIYIIKNYNYKYKLKYILYLPELPNSFYSYLFTKINIYLFTKYILYLLALFNLIFITIPIIDITNIVQTIITLTI